MVVLFGSNQRDWTVRLLILLLLAPMCSQAAPVAPSRATAGRSTSEASHLQQTALTQENKALKSELAALKETKDSTDKALERANAELRRLNAELQAIRQASANVLQIQNERDNLQEGVIRLERELEAVKRAKLATEEDHRQTWFMIGAGVLLSGMVLGLILPQLRWRRRSGWDSF